MYLITLYLHAFPTIPLKFKVQYQQNFGREYGFHVKKINRIENLSCLKSEKEMLSFIIHTY